jgi:hypothetical protein
MSGPELWPWVALALLGALHGLNPGMGWLFAAALGMQEGRSSAAWGALTPLALGHALAVGLVVVLVLGLGLAVPSGTLKVGIGALLVGYGLVRLFRGGHPRWGGMRVGSGDLAIWSFLMASAHGAGLMVLPFFMAGTSVGTTQGHPHSGHAHIVVASSAHTELIQAGMTVLIHTVSYMVVTGAIAALVVHWLGLRLLRALWIDLDRIWAVALILTGALTLFV